MIDSEVQCSLVARTVRDREVASSSLVTSTNEIKSTICYLQFGDFFSFWNIYNLKLLKRFRGSFFDKHFLHLFIFDVTKIYYINYYFLVLSNGFWQVDVTSKDAHFPQYFYDSVKKLRQSLGNTRGFYDPLKVS